MKKNKLLLVLTLLFSSLFVNGQTGYVNFTFLDICTGNPIPNGYQFNFTSNGNPGAYYAMYPSGGWHAYTPVVPNDLIGCGHVESANPTFANIVSVDPQNSWCPTPNGYIDNYTVRVNLNGNSFTVNGQQGAIDRPRNIPLCRSKDAELTMVSTVGVINSYEIIVTKGTWSGSFTPSGSPQTTGVITSSTVPNVNLITQFASLNLGTYNGYILVELKTTNCYNTVTTTQVFNIVAPAANTNFTINGSAATTSPSIDIISCAGTSIMFANTSSPMGNVTGYSLNVYLSDASATQGSFINGTSSTTGGAPSSVNLKTSAYLGTNPSTNYYLVVLSNTFCGHANPVTRSALIKITNPPAPSVTGLNVNGNSWEFGAPPSIINICPGGALTMSATGTNITSYTVSVAKGYYSAGLFNQASSSSVPYTATSISTANLLTLFSSYLSGYSGHLQVRVTGSNICGVQSTDQIYINIGYPTPISASNFDINSIQQTNPSVAPTVWMCNSAYNLVMNTSGMITGTVTSYDIKVAKGSFSGSTFTANLSSPEQTINGSGAVPASQDLMSNGTISGYLNSGTPYSGYIRITLIVYGPCGPTTTKAQVFNIQNATATVDFTMQCKACTTGTARYIPTFPITSSSFPSWNENTNFQQPGWQGASSSGIYGFNNQLTTGLTANSHNIKVEQVDLDGEVIGMPILEYNGAGVVPLDITWDSWYYFPDDFEWFEDNYGTIASSACNTSTTSSCYIFRVTVTVNTSGCGDVSNHSYFKIAHGTMGQHYRTTSPSGTTDEDIETVMEQLVTSNDLMLYPNPANDAINFEWFNSSAKENVVQLVVTDVQGKAIILKELKEQMSVNKHTLDISSYADGVYFYRINIGGDIKTGKFTKR